MKLANSSSLSRSLLAAASISMKRRCRSEAKCENISAPQAAAVGVFDLESAGNGGHDATGDGDGTCVDFDRTADACSCFEIAAGPVNRSSPKGREGGVGSD